MRQIATAAPGFISLAEGNESYLSASHKILSFQAHPEIDGVFGKKILEDDDTTYTEGQTQEHVQKMIREVSDKQDGLDMLRRVVRWVNE